MTGNPASFRHNVERWIRAALAGSDDAIGRWDLDDTLSGGRHQQLVDRQEVLVSPGWVTRVSWAERDVHAAMTRQPPKASPEWNANHGAAYVQHIDEQCKFACIGKFGPSNANSTRTRKGGLESGRAVRSKWLPNEMITTQKAGVFFCAVHRLRFAGARAFVRNCQTR